MPKSNDRREIAKVPRNGNTHYRLLQEGGVEISCTSSRNEDQWFAITPLLNEKMEEWNDNDAYTLTWELESPVWGVVSVTAVYGTSPSVSILAECGTQLEAPEKYINFHDLLKQVKQAYCRGKYAFNPCIWDFIPKIPAYGVGVALGLNASMAKNEATQYVYVMERSNGLIKTKESTKRNLIAPWHK